MKNKLTCNHIGIFTEKPYKLINFYRQVFGLKREKEEILAPEFVQKIFGLNARCIFVKLKSADVVIEIFAPVKKKLKHSSGLTGFNHIGIGVKEREEFIKQLKKNGVKIISVKRNSHKVYFLMDPDMNLIEIREG
ncbi:MAG: VOC family protein [bacterium]